MRVKITHLPVIFEAVKKIREALAKYCEAPDKVPVSLDDITHTISELHGIKIVARLVLLAVIAVACAVALQHIIEGVGSRNGLQLASLKSESLFSIHQ